MTRAAIYARYSSDLQSAASIEDQVRLCRERAVREGWTVAAVYTDAALSGASALRPGYQKLLEDVRGGTCDVVLAEALDRLSRDQEHVAGFFKQMRFAGVSVVTLAEGEIGELHVGLKGTMNALFLKDLADKTRRGLRGRVEQGRSGGGLCYGYKVVHALGADGQPVTGERRIDEAEAAIVRRIYSAFASGQSPRGIAKELNAERVPGPSGHGWTPSTIHGNRQRGTGILNNDLYRGELVWNRLRYAKDPATGRRLSRLNDESAWVRVPAPELRIVDDALWAAVRQRQDELSLPRQDTAPGGNRLNATHRPRHLLSGLLRCGTCGGSYAMRGRDRYACANHGDRGTCTNGRSIARSTVEARVLGGLKDKLLAPDCIAAFVQAFQAEWNRERAAALAGRAQREAELAQVKRRIAGLLDGIEHGIVTASTRDRLLELEARAAELQRELAGAPGAEPPSALHPHLAETYRRKVANLEAALNDPACRAEAALALRALIEAVIVRPEADGSLALELFGELAALLRLGAAQTQTAAPGGAAAGLVSAGMVSMVAGTGFEPVTFRL